MLYRQLSEDGGFSRSSACFIMWVRTPGGWGRSPEGDAPQSEAYALAARRLLPARPQPLRGTLGWSQQPNAGNPSRLDLPPLGPGIGPRSVRQASWQSWGLRQPGQVLGR